jgi:hypothetical protein
MMAGVARPGDVKQSLRQPRTESRKFYSLGGSLEFLPSLIVQKSFFGLLIARSPIALRDYFRTMQRPAERSRQYFSIWRIFAAASGLHRNSASAEFNSVDTEKENRINGE